MTEKEKAKAYDEALERARKLYNSEETSADVEIACETIFPELAEPEDELIRKEIIAFLKENLETGRAEETWSLSGLKRWIAWLEKQGNVNALIQEAAEKSYTEGMRVERKRWLEKQGEQNLASSAKISKNEDTFLDLLNKMPSYITVDGIFYHFRLRKTTISYMAFYEGEGEGSGNVIFWMTAFSPIDLLNEMLEKLKKKGLLE